MEHGKNRIGLLLTYAFLAAAAFSILLPLALMVVNSLRNNFDIFLQPIGLPDPPDWGVYRRAWEDGGLGRAFLNSLRILHRHLPEARSRAPHNWYDRLLREVGWQELRPRRDRWYPRVIKKKMKKWDKKRPKHARPPQPTKPFDQAVLLL